MKRLLFSSVIFICGFAMSNSAKADIEASTGYVNLNAQGAITQSQHLTGAAVQGSWTEAFIDFLQLSAAVRSLLDGNPYAGYQAYQEFNQFLSAASDKGSFREARLVYQQGTGVSKQRLTFLFRSDDDPIGILSVAYPNGGTVGSLFARTVSGIGQLNGRVTLEYAPESLPRGKYVFAFYGKETDCVSCLSISNVITLEVRPKPTQCRVPFGPCINLQNSIDAAYAELQKLDSEEQKIIDMGNRNNTESAHALINRQKQAFEICRHHGAPGSPQYESCIEAVPEIDGICDHLAYAQRRNDICQSLASIKQRRDTWKGEIARLASERSRYNCCIPVGPLPDPID